MRRIQQLSNIFGWLFLIIAAAHFTYGVKEKVTKQAVHKYVLINDASGSMVSNGDKRGVGQGLKAVEAGNKALLDLLSSRSDGSKDFVGATVFDHDSYVVSYLVDDPQFVKQKLSTINYNLPPLGGGTQLDRAIWGGIEVIINSDDDLDQKETTVLMSRIYGSGDLKKDDSLLEVIRKHKPKSDGASLVIFTDGVFSNVDGTTTQMSGIKLLELCDELGIRVYMISVSAMPTPVLSKLKETGGDGIVSASFDAKTFSKIYRDIVNSQSQETVVIEQTAKKSFSTELGIAATVLLLFGFIQSHIINRRYTEV